MSFFLLGKGPDGDLFLLSTMPADTRKDALDELSRLTESPGFVSWDAEVYVVDIDRATPVLLVRPSAERAVAEPEEFVDEALLEQIDADAAVIEEASPLDVVQTEPEALDDEALAAVIAGLGADAVDDAVAFEAAEPVVTEPVDPMSVDAAWAEAVVETLIVEDPAAEAEAEESPEGPEVLEDADVEVAAAGEPVDEPVVEPAADLETTGEPDAAAEDDAEGTAPPTEELSLKDALARTAAQMEAAGITPPESVGPLDSTAEPAWPWDTRESADEEPAFTLDDLEEPGEDDDSLVRAAGDEETLAASRVVILGSYEGESEPAADSAEAVTVAAEAEDSPELTVGPDVEAGEAAAEVEAGESDFILDLEDIAADTSEEPAGYQPSGTDVADLTCDDCVYVEGCPNREEREPASCGSFQWK
jgi:hypothetical protein